MIIEMNEEYAVSSMTNDIKLLIATAKNTAVNYVNTTYDVSESDIMDRNYLSYFEYPNPPLSVENIESAGIDLLKAIFTYYIRQERFQEGLWLYAASEGIFLMLLYRLKALTCDSGEEQQVCPH
ncbi:MAG: DUF6508 domain-containing protein [Candidatus Cloacimonetes bacterium]|nr:DUF6508 domain-containing protein [Candidatus Cloacimonadota bacterium]